jgi:predicted amidophosphoribosyltransferase
VFTETRRVPSSAFPRSAALWNFLLPSVCLACRRRDVEGILRGGVCPVCWDGVAWPSPLRCSICDEPLGDETADVCGRCRIAPPPFTRLRAAAPYRGAARDILLAFKFRGADYLARHLAVRMRRRIEPPAGALEVVAVPGRESPWKSGEHAARLLAAAVARDLGIRFAPGRLEKIRPTEKQSTLSLARRERNVRGAFRARGRCPRTVLLVDDVATSGATARECSERLRGAGAETVLVWCFARASRSDAELEVAEPQRADPPARGRKSLLARGTGHSGQARGLSLAVPPESRPTPGNGI